MVVSAHTANCVMLRNTRPRHLCRQVVAMHWWLTAPLYTSHTSRSHVGTFGRSRPSLTWVSQSTHHLQRKAQRRTAGPSQSHHTLHREPRHVPTSALLGCVCAGLGAECEPSPPGYGSR